MSKKSILKAKGLYTFPNPLSDIPEGGLAIASDVIINEVDTISKRLGFGSFGSSLTVAFQTMYSYKKVKIGWDGTSLQYDNSGTWTAITSSSMTAPTGTYRIKTAQSNNNLYLATNNGVLQMDTVTAPPIPAGVPYPLDGIGTVTTLSGGWFIGANTVSYMAEMGYVDANNNTQISAPSEPLILSNPSGGPDSKVVLQWTIPTGLSTNYFYRIYRTRQVADVSGLPSDPGAEVYEVVQRFLTATDISNQYIAYTDLTPDDLLGAAADTNPTQGTIASANYQPPYCSGGICFYKNNILYANIKTKQLAKITLIGVGGSDFVSGDTITVGTSTYTGDSSTTISTKHFKVFTAGTPAENIYNTARELVHVVNLCGQTQYWAINLSGFSSTPGQIQFVEQSINGAPFAITSSNGSNFNPEIPASGTTYSSTNQVLPHYVAVSKPQQPGAVPLTYQIPIGTADKGILNIFALRDSIFVFKEQGGIWRIQGTDITNFVVTQFDNTVNLIAPDSCATLANQVWFFSNQGIVAVNDNGPVIMSRQIEQDLRNISSSLYPNFASATYAVGYETDRQYQLYTVSNTTDTIATNCWVFNYMADVRAWVNWVLTCTAAIVDPVDDTLYLSNFQNGLFVGQQRRTQTIFDYADFDYAVNIVSSIGKVVTLSSTATILAGMTLYQTDGASSFVGQSIVVSVDSPTKITITDSIGWLPGTATVYSPINSFFEYINVGDNFDIVKHFTTVELFFRETNFTNLIFSVYSDMDRAAESVSLTGTEGLGWGEVPWGEESWGGDAGITNVERTFIPQNKARAHWLNPSVQNNEALSNFALTGINIYFNYVSDRMK